MKFIVDSNVGRLARWLRIAGFDTVFINDLDDNRLVKLALSEGRVLLTKDTQILKRRLATTGRLKVILIESEKVKELVPPYVFKTQTQYVQCPSCHRVYWRGTHWQRMSRELEKIVSES